MVIGESPPPVGESHGDVAESLRRGAFEQDKHAARREQFLHMGQGFARFAVACSTFEASTTS